MQGTINGYGERTGNANLDVDRPEPRAQARLRMFGRRAPRPPDGALAYVDDVANVEPNPQLPFVGDSAFAHNGGIYVHAVVVDPRTYEHLDPAAVGNRRHIIVSEQSGRSNVVERARELGVDVDPASPAAKAVAARIKELEDQGFQFEGAEASFELLVRRAADDYHAPFEARAYAVDSRKGRDDDGSSSTASAEVGVGDEVLRGEATGLGPVNALEKAFRHALIPAYPNLARVSLTDFRANIARSREGTRGRDPRSPHRNRAGSRALDDSRELIGPAALELACAHRLSRARDRAPRRDRSRASRSCCPMPAFRSSSSRRSCGPSSALRTVRCWSGSPRLTGRRRSSTSRTPPIGGWPQHATALGVALFYNFGNFCAIAAHPRWDSVKRVNLRQRPAREPGRQRHLDARSFRAPLRLVAATARARSRTRARADGRLLRARPDGLPRSRRHTTCPATSPRSTTSFGRRR